MKHELKVYGFSPLEIVNALKSLVPSRKEPVLIFVDETRTAHLVDPDINIGYGTLRVAFPSVHIKVIRKKEKPDEYLLEISEQLADHVFTILSSFFIKKEPIKADQSDG